MNWISYPYVYRNLKYSHKTLWKKKIRSQWKTFQWGIRRKNLATKPSWIRSNLEVCRLHKKYSKKSGVRISVWLTLEGFKGNHTYTVWQYGLSSFQIWNSRIVFLQTSTSWLLICRKIMLKSQSPISKNIWIFLIFLFFVHLRYFHKFNF